VVGLTPEPSSPMSLTSEPDEFLDLPLKTERELLNISKLVDENQTIVNLSELFYLCI